MIHLMLENNEMSLLLQYSVAFNGAIQLFALEFHCNDVACSHN